VLDKTPSEVELLRASVKGNTTAFETIVEKYQSLVCAITYGATTDLEKSEELAHEAFIKAWTNLSQLQDLTKFRAWLCTIVQNIIRNYFRDKKRDIVSQASSLEEMGDISSESFKAAETIIDKEQQAVIRQALEQIPEKYRTPLVLFYRQEQSIKKVAEMLKLSEEAVKTQISRGRKMLKEQVAAMVETTISRTGPSKAFTTAVIASVAGLAIKGSGAAAAAGIAATATTAGTKAIMTGVATKIITAAAIVAIGVGAAVVYKRITVPPQPGMRFKETGEKQIVQKKQRNEVDNSSVGMTTQVGKNNYQQAEFAKDDGYTSPKRRIGQHVNNSLNKAEAKTGISGIVIDKSSSKPIKGAEVFYGPRKEPHESCFTDANGHFEFIDMKPQGQQCLYIVAKNYTSRQITLDIIKDKVYENFRIELTPSSKVTGIVYDQSGKPVKGAIVETFQFTNPPMVTDANGIFEIDGLDPAWGQYSLHVTHPNYPAFSTSFSPANAGETAWQDVVLKLGVTIYGQVTDAEGNPVSNVDVGNTTSRVMWNCIKTKTDHEGKYELKNVDVGELVLWAIDNENAPYVERFSLDDTLSKKLINIQLANPLPLHGKVIDKQGNPVSGVNVSIGEYKGVSNLTDWMDRVTSDSEGKFTLRNAPPDGKVILEVFADFLPNLMSEVEIGQEEEYIIEVDRAGRIYGKVVDDKTDEPIRKFNVKITFSTRGSQPGWGYSATWNSEGHNFDSSEGFFDTGRENIPIGAEYSITVYADGFDPLTMDPVIVQPISNEPNRTEFRLKPATAIAGRVVDINSTPIAGVRIRILSDNDSEHWDDRDTAVVNSKGEFLLSGLGSQEQLIYITAETFAPYIGSSSDLPKNSEGTIQITLEHGVEVSGRVFDSNGKGVADARVCIHIFTEQLGKFLRSPWPNLKQTTTDIDGYYEIFDLPAGSFSMSVNSSVVNGNLHIAHKKISLKAGQSVEIDFGNEAGFTITGAVRAGEKPLEKASVEILLPGESVKWGYTDNTGRFQIAGIPKGTYNVYTSYHSGFNPKTFQWGPGQQFSDRRQVAVEGNVELDIDLGDVPAGGKISE
jgi:RNA polymerase sigma factor (sigma-70 family)